MTMSIEDEIRRCGSSIFAFGANDVGQLALGDCSARRVPCMVEGGAGYKDAEGVVSMGPPIAQVSAGGFHTILLDIQGSVFVCGENFRGQLGIGERTELSVVHPRPLAHGEDGRRLPSFAKVSAGTSHSLFLTPDGRVYACGEGAGGRLGVGDERDRAAPCLVTRFDCPPRPRRRPLGLTPCGLVPNPALFPEDVAAQRTQVWGEGEGEVRVPLWMKPEGPAPWDREIGVPGTRAAFSIEWARELEAAARNGSAACAWDRLMYACAPAPLGGAPARGGVLGKRGAGGGVTMWDAFREMREEAEAAAAEEEEAERRIEERELLLGLEDLARDPVLRPADLARSAARRAKRAALPDRAGWAALTAVGALSAANGTVAEGAAEGAAGGNTSQAEEAGAGVQSESGADAEGGSEEERAHQAMLRSWEAFLEETLTHARLRCVACGAAVWISPLEGEGDGRRADCSRCGTANFWSDALARAEPDAEDAQDQDSSVEAGVADAGAAPGRPQQKRPGSLSGGPRGALLHERLPRRAVGNMFPSESEEVALDVGIMSEYSEDATRDDASDPPPPAPPTRSTSAGAGAFPSRSGSVRNLRGSPEELAPGGAVAVRAGRAGRRGRGRAGAGSGEEGEGGEGSEAGDSGERGRGGAGRGRGRKPREASARGEEQAREISPGAAPAGRAPRIVAVSAGHEHSLLLDDRGRVYACGRGAHGKLGQGDDRPRLRPTRVRGIPRASAVSAGGEHSLVLARDGAVFAFGRGAQGQLGVEDGEDYFLPVRVVGEPRMVAVSAGGAHSVCLDAAGTAYAFGCGGSGRLGLGDVEDRHGPEAITVSCWTDTSGLIHEARSIPKFVAADAALHHTLLLDVSGRVFAVGGHESGRLGMGDHAHRFYAAQVMGLPKALCVSAGHYHSMVLVRALDAENYHRSRPRPRPSARAARRAPNARRRRGGGRQFLDAAMRLVSEEERRFRRWEEEVRRRQAYAAQQALALQRYQQQQAEYAARQTALAASAGRSAPGGLGAPYGSRSYPPAGYGGGVGAPGGLGAPGAGAGAYGYR